MRKKVAQGGQDRLWKRGIDALDSDNGHKEPGQRKPTGSMVEYKNATERMRDARMRYSNTEGKGRGGQGETRVSGTIEFNVRRCHTPNCRIKEFSEGRTN
jgi:hypothetical protein